MLSLSKGRYIVKMAINTIYLATEGEGVHVGRPQVFVRFQGCQIGCLNCDSKETWDFLPDPHKDDSRWRDLADVVKEIEDIGFEGKVKRVSITGGDPLHPQLVPQVLALIKELKEKNYVINIEASGLRVVKNVFDLVDFISFDFKTPSTGVKYRLDNLVRLHRDFSWDKFQVKAVIAHIHDFSATVSAYDFVIQELNLSGKISDDRPAWVLTPCYEPHEEFSLERFEMCMRENYALGGRFRVIGQQHKFLYGPGKKSV
jgi:7-carboxy-7-deazaguanine synthase